MWQKKIVQYKNKLKQLWLFITWSEVTICPIGLSAIFLSSHGNTQKPLSTLGSPVNTLLYIHHVYDMLCRPCQNPTVNSAGLQPGFLHTKLQAASIVAGDRIATKYALETDQYSIS